METTLEAMALTATRDPATNTVTAYSPGQIDQTQT